MTLALWSAGCFAYSSFSSLFQFPLRGFGGKLPWLSFQQRFCQWSWSLFFSSHHPGKSSFLNESNVYAIILLDKTCWRKLHHWEDWYHYKLRVITSPGLSVLIIFVYFPIRLMLVCATQLFQLSTPSLMANELTRDSTEKTFKSWERRFLSFPSQNLQTLLPSLPPLTLSECFFIG